MFDGDARSVPVAPPGTMFAYSNLGYSVLAVVVEREPVGPWGSATGEC
jgi:hypothetical protein